MLTLSDIMCEILDNLDDKYLIQKIPWIWKSSSQELKKMLGKKLKSKWVAKAG